MNPQTPKPTAPDRELILSRHRFPGEYTIKAFGPGAGDFVERVLACAQASLAAGELRGGARASRTAKHVCVTLDLHVETVDQVLDVYAALYTVEDLAFIL